MTTYFVTTGMSLLSSSRCWNGLRNLDTVRSPEIKDPKLVADYANLLKSAEETRNNLLGELTSVEKFSDQSNTSIKKHSERLKTAFSNKMYHILPAELATIRMLNTTPADKFVFLHGTGDNQKVAHLLCAILLFWKEENLIQFDSAKTKGPFDWDPINNNNFNDVMDNVYKKTCETNDSKGFIFTGGYKGVLISLTNKITFNRLNTNIYYVYGEEGHNLIEIRVEGGVAKSMGRYLSREDHGL